MIRHVVLFRWNESVDDDAIAAIGRELDRLVTLISEIAVYRHGPDLALADDNADYAIVAEFESLDDFTAYRDHPEHQRVIAEVIKPNVASRTAAQF